MRGLLPFRTNMDRSSRNIIYRPFFSIDTIILLWNFFSELQKTTFLQASIVLVIFILLNFSENVVDTLPDDEIWLQMSLVWNSPIYFPWLCQNYDWGPAHDSLARQLVFKKLIMSHVDSINRYISSFATFFLRYFKCIINKRVNIQSHVNMLIHITESNP